MPLTKCKECGHDISTNAEVCQNCGTPDYLSDNAREALRKEMLESQKPTSWLHQLGKNSPISLGCLGVVIIFLVFAVIVWIGSSGTPSTPSRPVSTEQPEAAKKEMKTDKIPTSKASSPPKTSRAEPAIKELNASISLSSTQFLIANDDKFDWRNVKMEINGGILRGGYILENPTIAAGGTYVVGMGQFAKSDGTRFNPSAMKVQKFVISALDNRGQLRTWIGGWK